MNVKMKNLFPSSKSCHTFCRVHRVYGMQNDRLDLTIILAEKNWKKMLCSQRYWQNKERKIFEKVQISLATEHFLPIFFSKNDREIEPVVLHTINPMNSTKCVTTFSWIFDFSLIDFSGKIFEIFFLKWGMPCGYMELYTRSKQKKKYFWLRYGFLPRMLGLE